MIDKLFDAQYYGTNCGRPYQRDEHWLSFFDGIAENIFQRIQPKTVLDAGCAWGFLVEKLRLRDIDTWGVDISEFAIANVHESIKPFCWVGSVADAFPQKYDLIVCIEVLEHMSQKDAQKTIVNFCDSTEDILFSSSPYDYQETTHVNVHPPDVWAELFALNGFYRDTDFDASFLTPWAVRFRKRQEPTARIVREYERRFWYLWKENTDLRKFNLSSERIIFQRDDQIKNLEQEKIMLQQEVQNLGSKLSVIENKVENLLGIKREYDQIVTARSWKLMTKIHRVRARFIPIGSKREKAFYALIGKAAMLRRRFTSNLVLQTGENYSGRTRQKKYTYSEWISDNEPTSMELAEQKLLIKDFSLQPLISILTPVYNPPIEVIRSTIQSISDQTYTNWELCLADGGDDENVRKIILDFVDQDKRIKAQFLDENLGISGNTNISLKMASGEFVLLMDHDDLLAPNMLFEVIQSINKKPDLDIIYFDEDKIDETGQKRDHPFFKPDWSPEMLLSANYLTHPLLRKSLVEEVGGFDPEKDGTQDWDLIFRCTEKTDRVEHIPKILNHWRQVPGSTATTFNAKSYVFDRQIQCIEEHLQRIGIKAPNAYFDRFGYIRVSWPIADPKVSIIIPTKNNDIVLKNCIDSILEKTEYQNFEIILVDNDSTQPEVLKYYATLAANEKIKIVHYPESFNFNTANNLGAKNASGDYLLFLNNDIEVIESNWLTELVRWAELPEIGVVGAKLIYPNNTVQHAGIVVGMQGHASHVFWGLQEGQSTIFGSSEWYRNYLAVTGACMMFPKDVFKEIGGFDEDYKLVFSDVEICLRAIENGYRVMYSPLVRLVHHEGKTRGQSMPADDIQRGAAQLSDRVRAGDPYFNPNLSYTSRIPVLARPDEEDRILRLNRLVKNSNENLDF